MDYWQSFRIKISHQDTYTRNHSIWRHQTNLMCTIKIFEVFWVSLTESVIIDTPKLIFISLL